MTTTTLDIPTDRQTETQSILTRCTCLLFARHGLGNHKKVELRHVEMERRGEKLEKQAVDELGARKRLFAEADLRPPRAIQAAARAYVESRSVDGGSRMFGPGAHLIPIVAVGEVDARLAQFQADLVAPVEALVERLPELIEARRATLGPQLFNVADYPTPERVRDVYRIEWSYVRFGAPDRLQEVSAAAYARSVAQWDAKLADSYQDVVIGLRESAALVLRELVHRLTPGADGKAKALMPTALRDLQDLLARLPVLNSVADDQALPDALARVGALAGGLDVATLKKAPGVRALLLAEAEQAAGSLDQLVLSGRRAMSFGPLDGGEA